MKKLIFLTIALAFLICLVLFSQEHTYVGANKCKICHKSEKAGKQFPIWQEQKHSKSFEALSSTEASAKAKEVGVENPVESPKCLKCHAPLSEKDPKLNEEGVTCEVCHGPGSAYKKMSIMKNKEEAVNNGLISYESPEAIKAQCLTCHQAHDKPFDFEAAWGKIKHPKPEKE